MTIAAMQSFGYGLVAMAVAVVLVAVLTWVKKALLHYCRVHSHGK
ncbi:MAG: hypothetical protein PHO10_04595 [Gemmiger sp.]|nr:hypothetical protein [Gemmiger sp.]